MPVLAESERIPVIAHFRRCLAHIHIQPRVMDEQCHDKVLAQLKARDSELQTIETLTCEIKDGKVKPPSL